MPPAIMTLSPDVRRAIGAGLLGLLLASSTSANPDADIIDDSELPSVADPANQVMTEAQEKRIKRFLKPQLYGNLPISEDPESNAYLWALAKRITEQAGIEQEFDLLIVSNSQINAFAMPGGLLTFYTGLLARARNESELAGVVAHEMAHVTQRHLARMQNYMSNSGFSLLTMAAVVLAGAANLSNLLPAAVLGQAAESQRYLNYSRANEKEADRFASRYLARAGIDPHGVADFFEVLMQHSGHQLDENLVYLSTHPASASRIAEARIRAQRYSGSYTQDREPFHYIRERIINLHSLTHVRLQKFRERRATNQRMSGAELYGFAVAMQQDRKHQEALELLGRIQTDDAEARILVQLAQAQSWTFLGHLGKSLPVLEKLHTEHPKNTAVEFYLAQAYLADERAGEALKLVRQRVRRGIHTPQTHRLLAEAANATGQPVISHLALADHYISKNQLYKAAYQLEIAEKRTKADSANQTRIDQRRAQILETVNAMRR